MSRIFEDLAEKRIFEEKKVLAEKILLRGKCSVEQIAEDLELPIEVVRELVSLQSIEKGNMDI